ncbi:uncharacterized protein LOC131657888 [Vicia villosa]|uniref:uncharacterized protein LOC131657888 n=1 Tax=Vicia villosa TaxID=3911 RepID=UPI00273C6F6D|nr:uncharacterized protein LOC131657888 [Vicia villosa]
MGGRNEAVIAAALQVVQNQPNVGVVDESREADDWWISTHQWLNGANKEITWAGDLLVAEYAAKFVELEKLYPYYNEATTGFSKCVKFENGFHPKIKKAIGYQQIHKFPYLVNSCRIYEEDNKSHREIISEKRGKQHQIRGKPYNAPTGKGKEKATDGKRTSEEGAPADIVCYKCGKPSHQSNACTGEVKRRFRCGKAGHGIADCKHKAAICFNYNEDGQISTQCQKMK